MGTQDSSEQYDSYVGGGEGTKAQMIGYLFSQPYTIDQVRYTEGKHFDDGGWWVGWREGAPDVVGQFPSNFVEPAEAGRQAGGRDREMSMQSVGSDEPLTPRATGP